MSSNGNVDILNSDKKRKNPNPKKKCSSTSASKVKTKFIGQNGASNFTGILEGSDVVSCYFCNQSFQTLDHLSCHDCPLKERQSFILGCFHCYEEFPTHDALNTHSSEYHPGNDKNGKKRKLVIDERFLFVCEFCHSSFPLKADLIIHYQTAEQAHTCGSCGFIGANDRQLRRHRYWHYRKLNIPVCHSKKQQTPSQGRFACRKCDKHFSTVQGYNRHLKFKHGSVEFRCEICGFVTKNGDYFTEHQQMCGPDAANKPKFACEECDNAFFSNVRGLKSHRVYVHNEGSKIHACPLGNCLRAFKTSSDLRRHLRGFHRDDPQSMDALQGTYRQQSDRSTDSKVDVPKVAVDTTTAVVVPPENISLGPPSHIFDMKPFDHQELDLSQPCPSFGFDAFTDTGNIWLNDHVMDHGAVFPSAALTASPVPPVTAVPPSATEDTNLKNLITL